MICPRSAPLRSLLVALLGVAGCNYGFSGGGGLPSNLHTAYVPPIQNKTSQFDLTDEFNAMLVNAVRSKLGLQLASAAEADAIITATLVGYDDRALNFEAVQDEGAQVFERQVTIRAAVEIRDVEQDIVVWSSPGVTGLGNYRPATELDTTGKEMALESLVQKIVDGAQSQW